LLNGTAPEMLSTTDMQRGQDIFLLN